MDKHKKGNAYIMVVFVSFPILLAALTALAVSINSRNISARHSDVFGMYELASAASLFAILAFEDAYLANREAAHDMALLRFEEVFDKYYGVGAINLATFFNHYRSYLLDRIWTDLQESFGQSGNVLTRQFEINLGTDHGFYGTMRITRVGVRIYFWASATKQSDNIRPLNERVEGYVMWTVPESRDINIDEVSQIKNLDYFTPWVVELKKIF